MTPPRGCTNLKLRQAARLATRHYEAHLAGSGLKITQYSVLAHVVRLQPVRAGDLAATMKLTPSALTRNLQPLLLQGLVELVPGVDDARSRVVVATPAGRARREAAAQDWKRAQRALNARLGEARVAALHALLDECIERLGAADDEGDDDDA